MKNFKGLLILLVCLFTFSCSKEEDPILVAEKFLNAMQERDFKTAKSYGTTETVKLLEQFEKIDQLNGTSDEEKPGAIQIVSEDIHGNTAVVYFKEEGNELEQKITLTKVKTEEGKLWKVAIKKEEFHMLRSKDGGE